MSKQSFLSAEHKLTVTLHRYNFRLNNVIVMYNICYTTLIFLSGKL